MDVFNSRNSHVWDFDNPHALFVAHHQHRFSVNVWCGIVHDHLIGPYILPVRLNGRTYHAFLSEVLPELLETVPLALRQEMWYQHDGAPAYFNCNVHFLTCFAIGSLVGMSLCLGHRGRQISTLSIFSSGEK